VGFSSCSVRFAIAAYIALMAFCAGCGGKRPSITIAAVGPMTGATAARGKALEQAARLAAETANAQGGVNGRRIHLDLYDDGDEIGRARELARRIASETTAVAVLGQVASSAAFAAGQVYKEQGIPALTGAASESRVTKDNDWFFRLLRDAAGQGRFLADYAHYEYGARGLAVMREKGTAGEEFAAAVRDQAGKERIPAVTDLEFAPAEASDPARLKAIAARIAKAPKGTIIALGAQYAEAPAVLQALRRSFKDQPFTALGYSSLATEGLNSQFAKTENAPGYYTEGLTVAAPQLGDVAGYSQTAFASRFRARFGGDPDPEAVRWFEAAQLVIQAIAAKGIDGTNIKSDRRRIRDWLASLRSPESAASGVAGPIYFDQDHNAQGGMTVGVFHDGRLIAAPVQFTPVLDLQQVPGGDRLQAEGMVIDEHGTKIVKTPVIYAGIDLNTLDNADVRNGTFAADFFLWFRYKGDDPPFDIHQIEFPTAVSGGDPGKEVLKSKRSGYTTVTHHVKGVFRADYEFSRFPFDQQVLRIPIQARNSSNYSLMLAYSSEPPVSKSTQNLAPKPWLFKNEIFFRDVADFQSSGGEGERASQHVQVDRINAAITIERDVLGYAVKNFLPLGCILVAVLIGYALAADVINPRVSIGVTALLTTSVLYQKVATDLPTVTYIMGLDYVFFAFFALCVLFLTLTVITYETHRHKLNALSTRLNQAGAGLTLIGLAGTLTFVWMRYWSHA
jgi:branched-chain amino acid transport system substrate-binding protein